MIAKAISKEVQSETRNARKVVGTVEIMTDLEIRPTGLDKAPLDTCPPEVTVAERSRVSVRWNEFLLLLWTGDLILTVLSLCGSLELRGMPPFKEPNIWLWCIVVSAIWTSAAFSLNSYSHTMVFSTTRSILNVTKCHILAWLVFEATPFLSPVLPVRRAEVLLPIVLGWPFLAIWRTFAAVIAARPQLGHRILLVGTKPGGDHLVEVLHSSLARQNSGLYQTLGLVELETAWSETDPEMPESEENGESLPLLGSATDLVAICTATKPDEIVLTEGLSEINPQLLSILLSCYEKGIQVSAASDLIEIISGKIPLRYANGDLRAVLPFLRPPAYRLFVLCKRIADVWVALIGLLFCLLVAPLVALVNLVFSPGPLLFSQVRVGAAGHTFKLYKFRSMIVDAEAKTGPVFASKNDSRIPFWGSILRKSRVDELPQFWNILKGDMSLIGPRPERPEFVESFTEKLPFYRARHSVRPGLTGWAQVRYPYGENFEDTVQKLQYDLYYVKHQSFYLDYLVFLQTFQVVLGLKGR